MSNTERTYIMIKVHINFPLGFLTFLKILIVVFVLLYSPTVSSVDSSAKSLPASRSVVSRSLPSRWPTLLKITLGSVSIFIDHFISELQYICLTDYADLANKPFFPGLVKYMASGPVIAIVFEGLDAVKTGRAMLGATNPLASPIGAHIFI